MKRFVFLLAVFLSGYKLLAQPIIPVPVPTNMGGTSAREYLTARTNLHVVPGTDVQAYSAMLQNLSLLSPTANNFIVGAGTNWTVQSGLTLQTNFGFGTMAAQNDDAVNIIGGTISGLTDLDFAGSGAANARYNMLVETPYDVRWSGALPDDALDDAAAIQTAIDTYHFVRVPYGNYIIESPIQLRGNDILLCDRATFTAKAGLTPFVIAVTNYYNQIVGNLLLNGSAAPTITGLLLQDKSNRNRFDSLELSYFNIAVCMTNNLDQSLCYNHFNTVRTLQSPYGLNMFVKSSIGRVMNDNSFDFLDLNDANAARDKKIFYVYGCDGITIGHLSIEIANSNASYTNELVTIDDGANIMINGGYLEVSSGVTANYKYFKLAGLNNYSRPYAGAFIYRGKIAGDVTYDSETISVTPDARRYVEIGTHQVSYPVQFGRSEVCGVVNFNKYGAIAYRDAANTTYTITSSASNITNTFPFLRVYGDNPYVLTSTPTIIRPTVSGVGGVTGMGPNFRLMGYLNECIIGLVDERQLANTGLRLGAPVRNLGHGSTLDLQYSGYAGDGYWYEVGFAPGQTPQRRYAYTSTKQIITNSTDQIIPNAESVTIEGETAAVTVKKLPSIQANYLEDGQMLIIRGSYYAATRPVTLLDNAWCYNQYGVYTALQLGAAERKIGRYSMLGLIYHEEVGQWCELFYHPGEFEACMATPTDVPCVAGTTISVVGTTLDIHGTGSNITLTSTPSIENIADDQDGRIIVLRGRPSDYNVTLQDYRTLPGSDLRLNTGTRLVSDNAILTLSWDKDDGKWREISYSRDVDYGAVECLYTNTIPLLAQTMDLYHSVSNVVIQSAPSLANPGTIYEDGKIIILRGSGSYTVTLQDRGTLANSDLALKRATRVLNTAGSVLVLQWNQTTGLWNEIAWQDDEIQYETTHTWDPASLADGEGETSADITLAGAAVNDIVVVGPPVGITGMTFSAHVKSAGVVVIRIQNESGGAIDVASSTWKVRVMK